MAAHQGAAIFITRKRVYHEVYSTGKYIIDPRYSKTNPVVPKDEYMQLMNDLNPDVLEIKRYNNPDESSKDCSY